MKATTLFAVFALLCAQNGAANGNDQPKSYLRSQSSGQVNAIKNHRWLTTPNSVPFSLAVKIDQGSDKMDLVPTEADYSAVTSAVASWFDVESKGFYANSTGFRYVTTTCDTKDDGMPPGFYNTSAEDYDDTFQYQLSLSCHAKFDSFQPEGESSNVPSPLDVVTDALNAYSMGGMMSDYFLPAMPPGSAFEHVRRIALILRYSFMTTAAPVPMSNTTVASGVPMPTTPGTPATSAPPTTGAPVDPETPPVSSFPVVPETTPLPPATQRPPTAGAMTEGDIVTVPIILQWSLGAPNTEDLREPTDEEYGNFVTDAQSFVIHTLEKTFNLDDNSDELADFVSLENTVVRSKTYDATIADKPYAIVVESEASFQLTPGTTVPHMWAWVGALRNAGLNEFRTNYIAKRSGIFQNPMSVQWRALDA